MSRARCDARDDFEEHHLTATNETTGFLPDFTELGFVTFHTNSKLRAGKSYTAVTSDRHQQRVLYERGDHSLTWPMSLSQRVMAVGFDLKAAGYPSSLKHSVAQLFSGDAQSRHVSGRHAPMGPVFEFAGFVSQMGAHHKDSLFLDRRQARTSDLVLDNFRAPPENRRSDHRDCDHRQRRPHMWNTIGGLDQCRCRLLRAARRQLRPRTSRTRAAPSSSPAPARSAPITSTAAAQRISPPATTACGWCLESLPNPATLASRLF